MSPVSRNYRTLCRVWAVLLTAGWFSWAWIAWALAAIDPSAIWNVGELEREGQMTIFNSRVEGGCIGHPVEVGDYDGDGHVDFVLAPMYADSGPNGERSQAGEVYVYAGTGEIGGILDRAEGSSGLRGLTLLGARRYDNTGTELYTADVNGDGFEDLLVSAQNYGHRVDGDPDDVRVNCGVVYVILGRPGLFDAENGENRVIDLLQPNPDVVRIVGQTTGERFGIWVEAGDLDGDGSAEILVGADQWPHVTSLGDPRRHVGKTYVIYGRSSFPGDIDLATFSQDVSILRGKADEDHFGSCVHARDLDGNGYDELIVSSALNRLSAAETGESPYVIHASAGADGPDGDRSRAGETYVFHHDAGLPRLPAEVDLSEELAPEIASRLTTIYGYGRRAYSGEEVTSGDFDGDGFVDLVIGSITATSPSGRSAAGATHVIYWQPDLGGKEIDLAETPQVPLPDGLHISAMFGLNGGDILGDTLSAADFNNDGLDDLAVGIPHWDDDPDEPIGGDEPGRDRGMVAIVFGQQERFPALLVPQDPDEGSSLVIRYVIGADADDLLSYSMEARDVNADGFADLFSNAMRGDGADETLSRAGEAVVVSGISLTESRLSIGSISPSSIPVGEPQTLEIRGSGFTTSRDTSVFLGATPATEVRVESQSILEADFDARPEVETLDVTVRTRYEEFTCPDCVSVVTETGFLRGDANDSGSLDVSDAIVILRYLFAGSTLDCLDAADGNDDGEIQMADAIFLLTYLFQGGARPPAPFPERGEDPTEDTLDCRG